MCKKMKMRLRALTWGGYLRRSKDADLTIRPGERLTDSGCEFVQVVDGMLMSICGGNDGKLRCGSCNAIIWSLYCDGLDGLLNVCLAMVDCCYILPSLLGVPGNSKQNNFEHPELRKFRKCIHCEQNKH